MFRDAAGRGLIEDAQAGWLKFVASAEHALSCAKNAGGAVRLFAANVNRGRWNVITQADEDAALRRPDFHVYHDADIAAELSSDARRVLRTIEWAQERGYDGDLYAHTRRTNPQIDWEAWPRERWVRATEEIERWRWGKLRTERERAQNMRGGRPAGQAVCQRT